MASMGIAVLPDEILWHILSLNMVDDVVETRLWQHHKRTTLPLVCKRWHQVLFLQGARLTHCPGTAGSWKQAVQSVSGRSHCRI